jgi:hypothetical protein
MTTILGGRVKRESEMVKEDSKNKKETIPLLKSDCARRAILATRKTNLC